MNISMFATLSLAGGCCYAAAGRDLEGGTRRPLWNINGHSAGANMPLFFCCLYSLFLSSSCASRDNGRKWGQLETAPFSAAISYIPGALLHSLFFIIHILYDDNDFQRSTVIVALRDDTHPLSQPIECISQILFLLFMPSISATTRGIYPQKY